MENFREIGVCGLLLLETRISFIINEMRRIFNRLPFQPHLMRFTLVFKRLTAFLRRQRRSKPHTPISRNCIIFCELYVSFAFLAVKNKI